MSESQNPAAWQALTNEQIAEIVARFEVNDPADSFWREFARAVEYEVNPALQARVGQLEEALGEAEAGLEVACAKTPIVGDFVPSEHLALRHVRTVLSIAAEEAPGFDVLAARQLAADVKASPRETSNAEHRTLAQLALLDAQVRHGTSSFFDEWAEAVWAAMSGGVLRRERQSISVHTIRLFCKVSFDTLMASRASALAEDAALAAGEGKAG